MYKNGYNFIDGVLVQMEAAPIVELQEIPDIYYISCIQPPELMEYNKIFAVNTTTGDNSAVVGIQGIECKKIIIPLKTINKNWVNGSSPRFAQHWRRFDEKS